LADGNLINHPNSFEENPIMLYFLLNAVGFVLLAMVALHSVLLHVRLHRLRRALADAGRVLPALDASVGRMVDIADGFAQRLQTELATVEVRLAASRRMSVELASANRAAEEAASALDRLLRQHRRTEGARAAALPRELVEPKGCAERAIGEA
jgi:hypothetical protein